MNAMNTSILYHPYSAGTSRKLAHAETEEYLQTIGLEPLTAAFWRVCYEKPNGTIVSLVGNPKVTAFVGGGWPTGTTISASVHRVRATPEGKMKLSLCLESVVYDAFAA